MSGGRRMFDLIEKHSDRKAREMGYDGADERYAADTFSRNTTRND